MRHLTFCPVLLFLLTNLSLADVFNMPPGLTSLELVTVANPGNASHEWDGHFCGGVGYTYQISKYEITTAQYVEFLNAVAASDPYVVYNTRMTTNSQGCQIQRHGTVGNYTYSVAPDYANRPVNCVTWDNAARFCNWLANGQPKGEQDLSTTEDGSYFTNGLVSSTDLKSVTRAPYASFSIPSEDEWYKAAYHKNNGVTGDYWFYPTQSNSNPSNVLSATGTNNANFYIAASDSHTIGAPYWRTEVGAFASSPSAYGTFDQGGNILEWTEMPRGLDHRTLGGHLYETAQAMANTSDGSSDTTGRQVHVGFRIVIASAYYWDGLGDGDWDELNGVTGKSRWMHEDDKPLAIFPDDQTMDVVIRNDAVTLKQDVSIRKLSLESGALSIGDNKTLTVQYQFDCNPSAVLDLGTASHLTLVSKTGRLASVTAGAASMIHGSAEVGGSLSIGDKLGTLTIDGDLSMEGTSTYIAELGAAAGDVVTVTKNVLLRDYSTLVLRAVSPIRDANTGRLWGDIDRTILTAKTINGTFTSSPAIGSYLGSGVWLGDSGGHGINYVESGPSANEVRVSLFQAAPGDINGDREVAVDDIQGLLKGGKFNSGEPADWTEGDFSGDGLFAALDVQLVLSAALFKRGPYAAETTVPQADGANVQLRLTPEGLVIDTNGATLNGFVLTSESGLLTGEPANNVGLFQTDSNTEISGQMFFALSGEHLLGPVTGNGISAEQLAGDLAMTYTLVDNGGVYHATLVVPEPTMIAMLLSAIFVLLYAWRGWRPQR